MTLNSSHRSRTPDTICKWSFLPCEKWGERLKRAREHKTNKYAPLINDIQEQGHAVIFIPLEIGVRGIINQENKTSIEDIAHYTVLSSPKALGKSLSRESVIAPHYKFLNRNLLTNLQKFTS